MPNSQKKRDHVEIDGRASSVRRAKVQSDASTINTILLRDQVHNGSRTLTPWQTSKAARLAKRIASGKTFENWYARNAKK